MHADQRSLAVMYLCDRNGGSWRRICVLCECSCKVAWTCATYERRKIHRKSLTVAAKWWKINRKTIEEMDRLYWRRPQKSQCSKVWENNGINKEWHWVTLQKTEEGIGSSICGWKQLDDEDLDLIIYACWFAVLLIFYSVSDITFCTVGICWLDAVENATWMCRRCVCNSRIMFVFRWMVWMCWQWRKPVCGQQTIYGLVKVHWWWSVLHTAIMVTAWVTQERGMTQFCSKRVKSILCHDWPVISD